MNDTFALKNLMKNIYAGDTITIRRSTCTLECYRNVWYAYDGDIHHKVTESEIKDMKLAAHCCKKRSNSSQLFIYEKNLIRVGWYLSGDSSDSALFLERTNDVIAVRNSVLSQPTLRRMSCPPNVMASPCLFT